jgi:hypothetical protein
LSGEKDGYNFSTSTEGVFMKMAVFSDDVPCNVVEIDQCFRGAYCLHHQGDE